ncbi:unnamed protein product [Ilex paraguariensis]|uniref:Uncharacterized protein n=1 Tax=Ilex paraguariensis TaxID=185542 RepID=A0ABC8RZT2_9AQUA
MLYTLGSDPTENDSVEGLRPNARGPGLHAKSLRYIGSTIVGVGSPDPPQFVCDDSEYEDVFVSGNCLDWWVKGPKFLHICESSL